MYETSMTFTFTDGNIKYVAHGKKFLVYISPYFIDRFLQ